MSHRARPLRFVLAVALVVLIPGPGLRAEGPGRGLTAPFEREYLQFVIDHHFAALRITELAAGTDLTRDQSIGGSEGTAPSPDFGTTSPKAGWHDQVERAEREPHAARGDRRGAAYAARVVRHHVRAAVARFRAADHRDSGEPSGRSGVRSGVPDAVQSTPFPDRPTVPGMPGRERSRARRSTPVLPEYREMQMEEIDEMRQMLCRQFGSCDFIPFEGTAGNRD